MATFYVLYSPVNRTFVRAGHGRSVTISLNYAKHFTSEWSAKIFKDKMNNGDGYIIKKIQRQ